MMRMETSRPLKSQNQGELAVALMNRFSHRSELSMVHTALFFFFCEDWQFCEAPSSMGVSKAALVL